MAADLRFNVEINTKDAVSSLNSLKSAVTSLIGALAAREVIQFADAITSLNNRLKSLTPDLDVVNKQFQTISAIALQARSPLSATADLFYRIQRSAGELGISQRQAAEVTSLLAKALSASGQSAAEAAGPLLQFGQGLQSGVFQGDELRSILEGLTPVSKALADSLGVPVGALKQLGSQGVISAQVVIDAILKARDSINEAFGRTDPTIAQGFETIKTSASILFNEFDKNTGTSKSFANALIYIAAQIYNLKENINGVIEGVETFVKVLAAIGSAVLAVKVIKLLVTGAIALYGAFGQIVSTGKTLIETIVALTKSTTVLTGRWAFLGEVISYLLKPLAVVGSALAAIGGAVAGYLGIDELINKFKNFGDTNSDVGKEIADFKLKLEDQVTGLDDTKTASSNAAYQQQLLAQKMALVSLEAKAQTEALKNTLQTQRDRLSLETSLIYANGELVRISETDKNIKKELFDLDIQRRDAIKKLTDESAKLGAELSKIPQGLRESNGAKELSGRIGVINKQVKDTNRLYDEQKAALPGLIQALDTAKLIEEDRKRTNEAIFKSIEDQIDRQNTLGESIRKLNDQRVDQNFQRGLIGLTEYQKQIKVIEEDGRKAGLALQQAFAAKFNNEDGLTAEKAQELADGINTITTSQKELTAARLADLAVSQTWVAGWNEAFTKYKGDAENAALQSKTYFETFTKGFEDAIVRFVQTGKLSFKDLANSLIADFARIQAKKALAGLFGGGGISSGGFLGRLFGGFFADGGSPPMNKVSVVGERGPELFVPKQPGTIVPNGMLGGGQTVNTAVTYNIQAVDAQSFRTLLARDPEFIHNVAEQGRRQLPIRSRR